MKYLSFVAMMTLSMSAFAENRTEFDEAQEKICHEEARKVGCVKSAGAAADKACSKANKSKLPSKCFQILGI
jgi:hypothetical protein